MLYTHDHADHTHGIDDLRGIVFVTKRRVPIYAEAETRTVLMQRFDYCFVQPPGSAYPAILEARDLPPGVPTVINGDGGPIEAMPILLAHGDCLRSAFVSATSPIRPTSAACRSHRCAAAGAGSVDRRCAAPAAASHPFQRQAGARWIERLGAKRAILTHMTIELDYDALRRDLPGHIEPAYDGMVIAVA